jgi:hypothetical protein
MKRVVTYRYILSARSHGIPNPNRVGRRVSCGARISYDDVVAAGGWMSVSGELT